MDDRVKNAIVQGGVSAAAEIHNSLVRSGAIVNNHSIMDLLSQIIVMSVVAEFNKIETKEGAL
jgi:hypothetical protein